jgi:hypothetical protein
MELGDRDNGAWKYTALHFYELILEGKDTTEFWEEMLEMKLAGLMFRQDQDTTKLIDLSGEA